MSRTTKLKISLRRSPAAPSPEPKKNPKEEWSWTRRTIKFNISKRRSPAAPSPTNLRKIKKLSPVHFLASPMRSLGSQTLPRACPRVERLLETRPGAQHIVNPYCLGWTGGSQGQAWRPTYSKSLLFGRYWRIPGGQSLKNPRWCHLFIIYYVF